MHRHYFITLTIALFTVFSAHSQVLVPKSKNQEPYYKNEWYFGISLMTSYSGFVTYGWIKIHEDGRKEITRLTQATWMRQVTGQQASKANPDTLNFLELHQIKWQTFGDLWKIRYSEYPYEGEKKMEVGWAAKMFAPSDNQWKFLTENYNYSALSQFLYGDDMWRLLEDMQDPAWQAQYSSLK